MLERIGRSLLWLSGANEEVLEAVPTEKSKYMGVGGAVLTTAVMAFLAFTITLTAFLSVPIYISVPIGVLWGLAILNLDRWLVASVRRQDTWRGTVILILPRLFLAIVIGLVIAEPLVLGVFDQEVSKQAIKDNQIEYADRVKQLDKEFARIDELKKKQTELENNITNVDSGSVLTNNTRYTQLTQELTDLQNQLLFVQSDIAQSRTGSTGYQQKLDLRDSLQARVDAKQVEQDVLKAELLAQEKPLQDEQLANEQAQLKDVKKQISDLEKQKGAAEKTFSDTSGDSIGLLDRMEALGTLSSEHTTILFARWILTIFILAIDTLPIFVKLLMSFGKASMYDVELEEFEELTLEINAVGRERVRRNLYRVRSRPPRKAIEGPKPKAIETKEEEPEEEPDEPPEPDSPNNPPAKYRKDSLGRMHRID